MPDPTPTPARDWRALLIDRIAGLAVAVLAVVLYSLGAPDEVWILVLLGGLALVGVSVPLRGQRGFARVSAIVPIVASGVFTLLLLALLAMLAPGCASREVSGETMRYRLVDDPKRPAPACRYTVTIDGHIMLEGAIDECPAVPVCREVTP